MLGRKVSANRSLLRAYSTCTNSNFTSTSLTINNRTHSQSNFRRHPSITHQRFNSTSTSPTSPKSTSQTQDSSSDSEWKTLSSKIEAQQQVEETETNSHSKQDLASLIRIGLAKKDLGLENSNSNSDQSKNQWTKRSDKRKNQKELPNSTSNRKSRESSATLSGEIYTIRDQQHITTTTALETSLGGILQHSQFIKQNSSDTSSQHSWSLIDPGNSKLFFRRTYQSTSLRFSDCLKFFHKVLKVLEESEAKPRKLSIEAGRKVVVEFGRVFSRNHEDPLLKGFRKNNPSKDSLISFQEVKMAGRVEEEWQEFLNGSDTGGWKGEFLFCFLMNPQIFHYYEWKDSPLDVVWSSLDNKMVESLLNPVFIVLSFHFFLSQKVNSESVDPKARSIISKSALSIASSTSMGLSNSNSKPSQPSSPPIRQSEIEDSVPVSIGGNGNQSQISLNDQDQGVTSESKTSAVGAGLGIERSEESDQSRSIEESRPVEIKQSESNKERLGNQEVKKEAVGIGLGVFERSEGGSQVEIEESRPVSIASEELKAESSQGQGKLQEQITKESAVGSGLGVFDRSEKKSKVGIEDSRPVEIDGESSTSTTSNLSFPITQPQSSTQIINDAKTEALSTGLGISERESSGESRVIEESRPVEIGGEMKLRRNEMGLMSKKVENSSERKKDDGMSKESLTEKSVGDGMGMERRDEKSEIQVEEMRPVQIGGGDEKN